MIIKKYKIVFEPEAEKVFNKLSSPIKNQLNKKLEKVAINPHIPAARMSGGLKGTYKIKLRSSGFRVIYRVEDNLLIVFVIKVGKRDNVYD